MYSVSYVTIMYCRYESRPERLSVLVRIELVSPAVIHKNKIKVDRLRTAARHQFLWTLLLLWILWSWLLTYFILPMTPNSSCPTIKKGGKRELDRGLGGPISPGLSEQGILHKTIVSSDRSAACCSIQPCWQTMNGQMDQSQRNEDQLTTE